MRTRLWLLLGLATFTALSTGCAEEEAPVAHAEDEVAEQGVAPHKFTVEPAFEGSTVVGVVQGTMQAVAIDLPSGRTTTLPIEKAPDQRLERVAVRDGYYLAQGSATDQAMKRVGKIFVGKIGDDAAPREFEGEVGTLGADGSVYFVRRIRSLVHEIHRADAKTGDDVAVATTKNCSNARTIDVIDGGILLGCVWSTSVSTTFVGDDGSMRATSFKSTIPLGPDVITIHGNARSALVHGRETPAPGTTERWKDPAYLVDFKTETSRDFDAKVWASTSAGVIFVPNTAPDEIRRIDFDDPSTSTLLASLPQPLDMTYDACGRSPSLEVGATAEWAMTCDGVLVRLDGSKNGVKLSESAGGRTAGTDFVVTHAPESLVDLRTGAHQELPPPSQDELDASSASYARGVNASGTVLFGHALCKVGQEKKCTFSARSLGASGSSLAGDASYHGILEGQAWRALPGQPGIVRTHVQTETRWPNRAWHVMYVAP